MSKNFIKMLSCSVYPPNNPRFQISLKWRFLDLLASPISRVSNSTRLLNAKASKEGYFYCASIYVEILLNTIFAVDPIPG